MGTANAPIESSLPVSIWRANPVATIALAQLFGTSLWFSANSAADDLRRAWGLSISDIGLLTSAVQLGFILGTLVFALSGLADRFAASRIFACSAVSERHSMLALLGSREDCRARPFSDFWWDCAWQEFIRLG